MAGGNCPGATDEKASSPAIKAIAVATLFAICIPILDIESSRSLVWGLSHGVVAPCRFAYRQPNRRQHILAHDLAGMHRLTPQRSATRIVSRSIPSGAPFAPTVVMARRMISPRARIQEVRCSSQSGRSRTRVIWAKPGGPAGSISALAVRTPSCTAIAASQALTWGKGALARRSHTRRSPSALLSSR